MFKFTFSVIVAGAICQAFVLSAPVDSGPSLSQSVEIVGKAAFAIFKSAGEFAASLTRIVKNHVSSEWAKIVQRLIFRVDIMMHAAGESNHSSVWKVATLVELKEFQVVAKSVEEIEIRLDTMEAANKLIKKTAGETLDQITERDLSEYEGRKLLYASLDRNFQADEGLQGMYRKLREKNEREVRIPREFDLKKPVLNDSPKQNKQFMKLFLNFAFMQHIDNRLTTTRSHFILARSIVELAKHPETFDKVQSIYEETLLQQTEVLELNLTDANRVIESLFLKLKENFEKDPSINAELLTTQKDVAERRDWDRSIWDRSIWDMLI